MYFSGIECYLNSPSTQKDMQNLEHLNLPKASQYRLWNTLLQHVIESIVFELKWVESEFVSTTQASIIVLGLNNPCKSYLSLCFRT